MQKENRFYVKLLLFVLLGHVCLIGFGVADLIEIISDDLNDTLFALVIVRNHIYIDVRWSLGRSGRVVRR